MTNAVLDELIAHVSLRRCGFGGLWHVINHAAALAELANHGCSKLPENNNKRNEANDKLRYLMQRVQQFVWIEQPTIWNSIGGCQVLAVNGGRFPIHSIFSP